MSGTVAAFLAGSAATICYGIYKKGTVTGEDNDAKADEEEANPEIKSRSAALNLPGSAVAASTKQQVGFLSDLLAQLWSYINAAASQNIKETVEPQFKTLPGPLSTLHFTKCDLGQVPLRLDNIIVHDVDKATNTLQFDVDVHWDGRANIQLKANYLGSFGVKSIKLFGRMSVLMKPLVSTLSIVRAVQVAFINPPEIELDFVGLANIADMKMLKHKIDTLIQDNVKAMMVLPKRMLTKLDMTASFLDIYQPPIGICRMKLVNGAGFVPEERTLRSSDVPDAYGLVSIGDRTCRSKTVKDSVEPVWEETMDFVLCDHDQIVQLEVWDEDTGTLDSDDFLGSAQATVGDILLSGGKKQLSLREDRKTNGATVNLACNLLQLTTDLTSMKSKLTSPYEICGLVTIFILQAHELPVKKEDVAAHFKVTCGKHNFVTSTVSFVPGVDVINPFFDIAFHVPLTADAVSDDGKMNPVSIELINKEASLGTMKVDHADLVAAPDKTLKDKRKIGDKGALVEFCVTLRGVSGSKPTSKPTTAAAASIDDEAAAASTVEKNKPSQENKAASIRVTAVKAHGFKVEKRKRLLAKGDVPDVYCIIKYGSSPTPWRTKTIKNSCDPVWNESHTYPFLNHSQILNIDVFDEDSGARDKDDHLGSVRVTVGNILLQGGSMEIEIEAQGKPTGTFITLECELMNA